VLELGSGTGRLAAALTERELCRLWGVDPSPEMLAVAKRQAPGARFKLARAEALPFKDGWFERAVARLVVHVLDRPRAFAEVQRVLAPGGRFVVATLDPSHFDAWWLNRFFPSLAAIDRARFPTAEGLEAELAHAGFAAVRVTPLSQGATISRETALKKIAGRHISTFDLLDEREYEEGRARAARELEERIEYAIESLVAVAER
jgi:SAM-dependent methyltransferase